MGFIGWLILGEKIERIMGLIRAERLQSHTDDLEFTPGDLTGPICDQMRRCSQA